MTVTETPPETEAAEAPAPTAVTEPPRGLVGLLGNGDHKTIGRLWIGFSLLFLLVALVTAILVALEGFDLDELEILGTDTFFQVFTLYRVTAVFLVALPLLIGLGTYVVPLQLGSRAIAFPRAATAALWTWLIGSGIVLAAYGINGGPGGGEPDGVDLWTVGFGLVLIGLLLASVSIATTVLALRTEGMTLLRTPIFSWSMLVASSVWLLSLPVLGANLLLIYLDHRYGAQLFGVGENIWPQVAWAVQQPQIYVLAIPALGIIGEILPVSTGSPVRSHEAGFIAVGFFGLLAAGVEVQPFLAPGTQDEILYVGVGLLFVLPVLVMTALWADSARANRPKVSGPMLFAVAAWLMLLASTVAGAIGVIEPFHLLGTSYTTGHMNYVILTSVLAAFAGLWFWAPKILGVRLGEAGGRLAATLLLLGTVAACLPDLISGLLDQPEVVQQAFEPREGVEVLNLITAIGFAVVTLAVLLALLALLAGARRARRTDVEEEANPWSGVTLEWATTSPPPWNNFAEDPDVVTSARPLAREEDS